MPKNYVKQCNYSSNNYVYNHLNIINIDDIILFIWFCGLCDFNIHSQSIILYYIESNNCNDNRIKWNMNRSQPENILIFSNVYIE